jgi:mono/diheme cytochrome c family protein
VKAFIVGVIIGVILIPLGVYTYFAGGFAPVSTSSEPMPFEKMLARKGLSARVDKEAPKNVPIPTDEANYMAGAQIYKENCAVCHGLPGQPATPIANGMYPKPPQLFHGKGVTDDPAGESYWKVANGIRMTGMPGYRKTLSDTQMWQAAVLLANADKLPPSVQALLSSPTVPQPAPSNTAAKPTNPAR